MSEPNQSHVRLFVSHAAVDQPLARSLTDLLESALCVPSGSIRCTSSLGLGLAPGDDEASLRTDLNDASVVIGLLTPASLKSANVLMELGVAWGRGDACKTIMVVTAPVQFDQIPRFLRSRQAVLVDDDVGIAQLLSTVAKQCGMPLNADAGRRQRQVTEFVSSACSLVDVRRQEFVAFFCGNRPDAVAEAVFPTMQAPPAEGASCNSVVLPSPPAAAKRHMPGSVPKGITYIYPYEDAQAIVQLSEHFSAHGLRLRWTLDRQYCEDSAAPLPQHPLIAIGLGFNHVTSRLSRAHAGLFGIEYVSVDNSNPLALATDDFYLGSSDQRIPHGRPSDLEDYALLARVVAPGSAPHFVVGGRTASGTLAACLYLTERWSEFFSLYRTSQIALDRVSTALILKFNTANLRVATIDRHVALQTA